MASGYIEKHEFLQRSSLGGKDCGFVDDLILLEDIEEEDVTEFLSQRYATKKKLYTYIGPVLIAINPYTLMKENGMSIYDLSIIPAFSGRQTHEVAPHPFAIAESAYSHLMRHFSDECILVTGESGSGKTEASKHILEYIVSVSTKKRSKAASIAKRRMSLEQLQLSEQHVETIRTTFLASNPVIEAFGNAQTVRNYNSSRFGKYILLQLNYSGQVVGGRVSTYLLEKNRVFRQAAGERNFHVFYNLLAGATEYERTKWDLMTAKQYEYLEHGALAIDGLEDKDQHQKIRLSMEAMGMTQDEIQSVFQQVAAVLWLGNIFFSETESRISPDAKEALENTAELLGLTVEVLETMFLQRTMVVASRSMNASEHKLALDLEQSRKVRDTLAKSLYEHLFRWIVGRINRIISLPDGEHSSSIGILDIYGFEIFETNAFEQLCINYVNEKLQQLFISNTLQVEQEEYRKQGVGWENVEYFDNQIVCDLIESVKPPGIFPLMDEQCTMSDFSVDKLLNRFHNQFSSHKHYTKPTISAPVFQLIHYAGTVEYDVTNFMTANADTMYNDIYDGMRQSKLKFVQELFQDTRHSENERFKRPPSTSLQFRQQVNALIKQLNKSNPHYVRCIKPNEEKKPLVIEKNIFRHQIRYLGLVENLRVRRAGYCYREAYPKFLQRFKMLTSETWPNPTKNLKERDAVVALLDSVSIEKEDGTTIPFRENSSDSGSYALGHTKVFIRYPNGLFALENRRLEAIPKIVVTIERAFQRYQERLKLAHFLAGYNELKVKYDAVYANCQARKQRRAGSKDKASRDLVYDEWNQVSRQWLFPTNSWDKTLKAQERELPIVWAQSYVRANQQRRRMLRLEAAVSVFSAYWKGLSVRRRMDPVEWQRCRDATLGIRAELERFMGQKKRRRDTLDRIHQGDYLNCRTNPAFKALMSQNSQNQVLFAAEMEKVNQRFHIQTRVLMITESKIFNLKASRLNNPKLRRCISLSRVSQVSLSTLPDNYIVLHVNSEYDYLFSVSQKTEVVHILRERFRTLFHKELTISFSDRIKFQARPSEFHTIEFIPDPLARIEKFTKIDKRTVVVTVGTK